MITIVFGKPGCGKTAYMTADAVRYMNNSAECLELQRVSSKHVAELNAEYTLPAGQLRVERRDNLTLTAWFAYIVYYSILLCLCQ